MSSPAITPAVPLLPVAPLDGESGYLRWKESVLLRLHSLGLVHVLSEELAAGELQRARDDELCRGHILATLSDRLLPAYAHHATASAVWRAVGRTYDLDMAEVVPAEKARAFQYDEGKPVMKQLALLQAMTTGTPAFPLLPVAPLDGVSGYLRWKESVLLRLHTLGLAHMVLSEEKERPATGEKHRARDDALCRGHILATLSDRLLPVYAHHATAGAVWRAVARTYDLEMDYSAVSMNKASAFRYDEGEPLLEQLAYLEALATVGWPGRLDETGAMPGFILYGGFPPELRGKVAQYDPPPSMDKIWEIARKHVVKEIVRKHAVKDRALEADQAQPTTDGPRNSSSNGFRRPRKRGRRQR